MKTDQTLIFEQYIKSKNPNKYLLEQDLKDFENFLIREGLFDKFKQKATAAGKGLKDFATQKLLQPIVDKALSFLQKNDPDTLKKLQSAAAKGDQKTVDAIIAQGNQEKQKIEQSLNTQQEGVSYFDNYSIFSQIIFNEGLVSERKANLLIEKYAEEDSEADIAKGLGFKNREAFRAEYRKAGNINNYFKQNPDKAKQVNWDTKESAANNFVKFTAGDIKPDQPTTPVTGAEPETGNNKEGFLRKTYNWLKTNPIKSTVAALGVIGVVAAATGSLSTQLVSGGIGAGAGFAAGALKGAVQGFRDTKDQKGFNRFKNIGKSALRQGGKGALRGALIGSLFGLAGKTISSISNGLFNGLIEGGLSTEISQLSPEELEMQGIQAEVIQDTIKTTENLQDFLKQTSNDLDAAGFEYEEIKNSIDQLEAEFAQQTPDDAAQAVYSNLFELIEKHAKDGTLSPEEAEIAFNKLEASWDEYFNFEPMGPMELDKLRALFAEDPGDIQADRSPFVSNTKKISDVDLDVTRDSNLTPNKKEYLDSVLQRQKAALDYYESNPRTSNLRPPALEDDPLASGSSRPNPGDSNPRFRSKLRELRNAVKNGTVLKRLP